jgi:hypothetical protein
MNKEVQRDLENLIIVAGHAVYIADNFDQPEDDASWCLQSFQTGEPRFYIEHVKRGVEIASADPKALLIFSGGKTRLEAGRRSEAEGYFRLAEHFTWWQQPGVKERATNEAFARDSFENLLFSICRFRQCTGSYPQQITVISWAFKARRFDLHRQAIGFPQSRFHFIGANNPVDLISAERNEQQTLEAFSLDPYGIQESHVQGSEKNLLGDKRKARNPFNLHHTYTTSCPEIAGLLHHQELKIYAGDLPWMMQKSPQT